MKTLSLKTNSRKGSVLVVAILALTIIAIMMGNLLVSLLQRHNLSYQTAAWQEARMAAEAGIEQAMKTINTNPQDVFSGSGGWNGWSASPASSPNYALLKYASATTNNGVASGAALRASSGFLYMDNVPLTVDNDAGRSAVVDVAVHALYPDPDDQDEVWFRVRSIGTSGVQGFRTWAAPFPEDTRLRNLSMEQFRHHSASGPDFGTSHTDSVATPNASRLIEVIVRPVRSFSMAILTDGWMDLGNSNNYLIDSYNSDEGPYSAGTAKDNGDVASNGKKLTPKNYEILAQQTYIEGDVWTNDVGSDGTPRLFTKKPERISGEIQSGFEQDLIKPTVPTGIGLLEPLDKTEITAGSYTVYGDLGAFEVTTAGKVVIHVLGDWDTGSGGSSKVVLHEDASVKIYVKGDIDFGNGDINVLPNGATGVPGNLEIYGAGDAGQIHMTGNPVVSAAIFAPTYEVIYKGGGQGAYYGAVVADTWDMSGGGNAGFHYDEALDNTGPIVGYKVQSFMEDWRRMSPPAKN